MSTKTGQLQAARFEVISATRDRLDPDQVARKRTWCVYVPASAAANLKASLPLTTWGVKRSEQIAGVRPGDALVFVHHLASDLDPVPNGFPRVQSEMFRGVAQLVIRATAQTAPYVERDKIWSDDVYPHRLRLVTDESLENVNFNASEFSPAVVEGVRLSAVGGGRFVPADDDVATPAEVASLTLDELERASLERNLVFPRAVLANLLGALESGKHVILTGPPGTAKTTLAEVVAETAARAGRSSGYLRTTATADWTTYETIGGLKPSAAGGLVFAEGHFLDSIRTNKWLLIDELNRSNFDRAFGQLFTVLSGHAVELPYERSIGRGRVAIVPAGAVAPEGTDVLSVPPTWRVVATMNVFDKSLLFEMSFALMRRFAFIEIPAPDNDVFARLIGDAAAPDEQAIEMASRFLALREYRDLGPAVFMDLARYLKTRRELEPHGDDRELMFDAFYAYLLPQFEGIDQAEGEAFEKLVRSLVGSSRRERLRHTLNAVLGLAIQAPHASADVDGLLEDEPDRDLDPLT